MSKDTRMYLIKSLKRQIEEDAELKSKLELWHRSKYPALSFEEALEKVLIEGVVDLVTEWKFMQ